MLDIVYSKRHMHVDKAFKLLLSERAFFGLEYGQCHLLGSGKQLPFSGFLMYDVQMLVIQTRNVVLQNGMLCLVTGSC